MLLSHQTTIADYPLIETSNMLVRTIWYRVPNSNYRIADERVPMLMLRGAAKQFPGSVVVVLGSEARLETQRCFASAASCGEC